MRTLRFALAFSVGLLAATPARAAPKRAKTCKQRVHVLKLRLAKIPTHVGFGPPAMKLTLPPSKLGEAVTERGPIIDLRDEDLGFEGVPMKSGLDDLTELEKRISLLEKVIESERAPVYLRIDATTPVPRVMKVSCELAQKRNVHFVIEKIDAPEPEYLPAKPPQNIRALIGKIVAMPDPNARSKLLTQAFEKAITDCTALTDVVAAVALTDPEERPRYLKRALIDGVRACECKGVDIDTLEALTIMMTAPVSAASYSFAPNLPCGQSKPYGLPPTATYRELVDEMSK